MTNNSAANISATGTPAIVGPAQVGKALRANTDDIDDDNGLTNVDYTYQWKRVDRDGTSNETDVGTDSSTYTPTANDVGKRLLVEVEFDDDANNPEVLTSATSTSVVAPAPNGDLCPGDETGVWCATLTSEAYPKQYNPVHAGFQVSRSLGDLSPAQFRFNGVDYEVTELFGATPTGGLAFATTPNLPNDGAGLTLHLQTFGGEYGVALAAGDFLSQNSRWNLAYPNANAVGPLSGVLLLRGALSLSAFINEPTDDGTEIVVRLSRPANADATGAVIVTGATQVGETLTADISGIVDGNGRTKADAAEAGFAYNYRWLRYDADGTSNEVQVQDGPGATYTVVANDTGKTLRVQVTYRDDNAYEEELTSAATAVIGQGGNPVFDEGSSTTRSLRETLADATEASARDVGNPVTATDPNSDPLTYSLEGPDESKFDIDPSTRPDPHEGRRALRPRGRREPLGAGEGHRQHLQRHHRGDGGAGGPGRAARRAGRARGHRPGGQLHEPGGGLGGAGQRRAPAARGLRPELPGRERRALERRPPGRERHARDAGEPDRGHRVPRAGAGEERGRRRPVLGRTPPGARTRRRCRR